MRAAGKRGPRERQGGDGRGLRAQLARRERDRRPAGGDRLLRARGRSSPPRARREATSAPAGARPGSGSPRGSSRNGAPAARPRAPVEYATGPSTRGQRACSDCFAASTITRASADAERLARPLGLRALAHDEGQRGRPELGGLLRDPGQPLRADRRDEQVHRRERVRRRVADGRRRATSSPRRPTLVDASPPPRGRFRRRARPRRPAPAAAPARAAPPSRRAGTSRPRPEARSTTKRAPGTGRSTPSPIRRPASCQRPVRIFARTSGSRSRVTPERTTRPERPARARILAASGRISSASMLATHEVERPRRRLERPGVETHARAEVVPPHVRRAPRRPPPHPCRARPRPRAPSAAAASARTPEPVPTSSTERPSSVFVLEREQREPRRLVLARAEGARRRQAQRDPALRRVRVAGIARVDPEPPADGERPRRRAEGLERIAFRNVGRQRVPDSARPQEQGGAARGRPPRGRTRRDRGPPARSRGGRAAQRSPSTASSPDRRGTRRRLKRAAVHSPTRRSSSPSRGRPCRATGAPVSSAYWRRSSFSSFEGASGTRTPDADDEVPAPAAAQAAHAPARAGAAPSPTAVPASIDTFSAPSSVGDRDLASEHERRERQVEPDDDVVALALEDLVLGDGQHDVEIARRPAVGPRVALARQAQAGARLDAGRGSGSSGPSSRACAPLPSTPCRACR